MFRHKDCPDTKTVIEFIKSQVNWTDAVNSVNHLDFNPKDLFIKTISNHSDILTEVNFLYNKVGKVFWRSQDSRELFGLSLSYNPDTDPQEWKFGSFGHPRYRRYSKYDYFDKPQIDQPQSLKHDYLDSYGFRKFLPELEQCPALLTLLNSFSLPVVRVTARTIDGGCCYPTNTPNGGMHKDDPVFEMIRINVCLSNNGNFGLQYEGSEPIFTNPGDIYAINSDVNHRVYVNKLSYFKRTHLVIGLCPWVNYNSDEDVWYLNKYFGKIHPLDLVKNNLIFKKEAI